MIPLGKAFLPVLALSAAAWPGLAAAEFSAPMVAETAIGCRGPEGYAASFDGRRVFTLQPERMRAAKAALATDMATRRGYDRLIARADAALARRPGSVMDKRAVPPSGDRHDYMSIAPYWWPDPANARGPYVRRDGQVNPERNTDRFDRTALGQLVGGVEALGLAYYYSDKPIYAQKAATMIRTWFIDPATSMNPNMNFAQAVPGREDGRAEGVLDTSGFITVIDAIGLIGPSGALTSAETQALEQWFARYVDWMQTSRNGREEGAAKNNHGLWYDAQLARFALFARKPDIARRTVTAFAPRRIARQITPTGAMPAELARTRSFHYSLYALSAAYDVADSAACLGVDLFGFADADGRSLRRATDYVAPYRGRPEAWPRPELSWPADDLERLLARADHVWGPGAYPHKGVWGDGLEREARSQQ